MSITRSNETTEFNLHGGVFRSYVRPATGSTQLCGWKIELPPGLTGAEHSVSHEEVFFVLDGVLTFVIEGTTSHLRTGDAARVPAGATLRLYSGAEGGSAWVSAQVGLTATPTGGQSISPPWTQ
jgi:quercetin dioxygenase-like cupin family protein